MVGIFSAFTDDNMRLGGECFEFCNFVALFCADEVKSRYSGHTLTPLYTLFQILARPSETFCPEDFAVSPEFCLLPYASLTMYSE